MHMQILVTAATASVDHDLLHYLQSNEHIEYTVTLGSPCSMCEGREEGQVRRAGKNLQQVMQMFDACTERNIH